MTYREYITERNARTCSTTAEPIDTRSETTDELVALIMSDGYAYDEDVENAIIIRAGLDLTYEEYEADAENLIFRALAALGYDEDGRKLFYWVVDDALETRAALFEDKLDAQDEAEAIRKARREWDHLTRQEKKERGAFYLCTAPEDEDGHMDEGSEKLVFDFKNEKEEA